MVAIFRADFNSLSIQNFVRDQYVHTYLCFKQVIVSVPSGPTRGSFPDQSTLNFLFQLNQILCCFIVSLFYNIYCTYCRRKWDILMYVNADIHTVYEVIPSEGLKCSACRVCLCVKYFESWAPGFTADFINKLCLQQTHNLLWSDIFACYTV
jgi:hypothetical protein